jgi:hypothetical protein
MWWMQAGSRTDNDTQAIVIRPTAFTLLVSIGRALFVEGLGLLVTALVASAVLYQTNLRNDTVIMLIFAGIVLIALVRGSIAWQADLTAWQRHLALQRHRDSTGIPGYYQPRRY